MKPIAFLDWETTGTDVVADRIVQMHITKVDPTSWDIIEERGTLINPGVPIPKGASDIHGITDDMVKDAPRFAQVAKSLYSFLRDCNVGGFNIINFDVPMLSEEFIRCEIEWPVMGTLFFDAYKIFADKERRDLTGAVKFYLQREMEGAHGAKADVHATIDIFKAQIDKYEDLKAMNLEELSKFCVGHNTVDLAGKIVLNEEGVPTYGFGKDKGKTIKDNPGFGFWMLKNSFPSETKKVLETILFKKK